MRTNWGSQAQCQDYIEVSKSSVGVDDFKMRDGTGEQWWLEGEMSSGVTIIYLKKPWRDEVV